MGGQLKGPRLTTHISTIPVFNINVPRLKYRYLSLCIDCNRQVPRKMGRKIRLTVIYWRKVSHEYWKCDLHLTLIHINWDIRMNFQAMTRTPDCNRKSSNVTSRNNNPRIVQCIYSI